MLRDRLSIVLVLIALLADLVLWQRVLTGGGEPALYALNIGQGDSMLAVFPGGMTVLTDAGPDSSVVRELERRSSPIFRGSAHREWPSCRRYGRRECVE